MYRRMTWESTMLLWDTLYSRHAKRQAASPLRAFEAAPAAWRPAAVANRGHERRCPPLIALCPVDLVALERTPPRCDHGHEVLEQAEPLGALLRQGRGKEQRKELSQAFSPLF